MSAVTTAHLAQRSRRAGLLHSFLVGLGQMLLMSTNIRNIANGYVISACCFTFINTYVWLYVVRKAIHSRKREQFAYAVGSVCGVVLGMCLSWAFFPLTPWVLHNK